MLQSDWLDCIAFWRRRENYPPKGHCLKIFVIFRKRKKPVYSAIGCSAEFLTDTLVVNKWNWLRCWRLREMQESYSEALESHLARIKERGSTMATHPLDCHGCIYMLNWTELATQTTSMKQLFEEFPASHEPHSPSLGPSWGGQCSRLFTHYLLWSLGVLLPFLTNHVTFPSATVLMDTNKTPQTTQQPKTLEGAAQDHVARMDSVSKWWERVI